MTTRTPVRVLVVDDSVVVRRLVGRALEGHPEVEVVGVASDGRAALDKVAQLQPDAVTMDVEMPVMDGIAAVRALRAAGHRMPVVMFSTLTRRGAEAALDALAAGADDYVTKPTQVSDLQASLEQVAADLVPRLVALTERRRAAGRRSSVPGTIPAPPVAPRSAGRAASASTASLSTSASATRSLSTPPSSSRPTTGARPAPGGVGGPPAPAGPHGPVRAVVIGASTGGPEALARVVADLAAAPAVPMVLVQHMPPVFTAQLAARLDRRGALRVREAADGDLLEPGLLLVAPGDQHLEVVRQGAALQVRLHQEPPVNFCRPSVDVLFRSAVRALGGDLLAVVLTGMGKDGLDGCGQVVAAGGQVVVQDEESSVVWGMPGTVATAGLAHAVVPLDAVAEQIRDRVAAPRRAGQGAVR